MVAYLKRLFDSGRKSPFRDFIYWLDQAIQNGHEGAIKTAEDILNKYKAKESSNGKK